MVVDGGWATASKNLASNIFLEQARKSIILIHHCKTISIVYNMNSVLYPHHDLHPFV
jgi:hypothetical protein